MTSALPVPTPGPANFWRFANSMTQMRCAKLPLLPYYDHSGFSKTPNGSIECLPHIFTIIRQGLLRSNAHLNTYCRTSFSASQFTSRNLWRAEAGDRNLVEPKGRSHDSKKQ